MKDKLSAQINFQGESAFFIQAVMMQTGKPFNEVMQDMLSIYKEVYFNRDQELAWIEGDVIKRKLSTVNMWRKKQ